MKHCEHCAAPIPDRTTRPRVYCSDACRQAAYRRRKTGRSDRPGARNDPKAGTPPDKAENTPAEAPGGVSEPEIRNAAGSDTQRFATELPEGDGAGLWLWVDPRREATYNQGTFDQAPFLARAIARFRQRPEWGGQLPDTVKVHAEHAGNGLPEAAKLVGLQVKVDPLVAPGTYRLGIGGGSDA